MRILLFIKNWTLPLAMLAGAFGYILYTHLTFLAPIKPYVTPAVDHLQPLLIFAMLFITFCKVDPHALRLRPWHGILLFFQTGCFALLSLPLISNPDTPFRVVLEGGMICLICPTATAAAVITAKLNGNAATLTTYTILINLITALAVPLMVPLVHPHPDLTFWSSFCLIIGKVFPLLFCPFLAAMFVRRFLPDWCRKVSQCKDLAFYLWAVALSLAIAVTVRSLVHSTVPIVYEAGIAGMSLLCCALQFVVGRFIGLRHGDAVSAGQALGQKNTVFAIWMGYTYLTPVTALAGGFYSVWHNVYNSYQLYRARKV